MEMLRARDKIRCNQYIDGNSKPWSFPRVHASKEMGFPSRCVLPLGSFTVYFSFSGDVAHLSNTSGPQIFY